MLKGEALIEAEYAVYDPQNVSEPKGFSANGSKAKHLAVVLNRSEAETLIGKSMQPEDLARALAEREQAEVVVLKCGPFGALVLHKGEFTTVPAYQTDAVFKVGSGDVFVAVFAHYWMGEQLSPRDAAERASRATAFYVQNKYPPSNEELAKFQPSPVTIGQGTRDRVNGKLHKVYLAGPFFTMGQFWVIEEAMRALISMGMNVLSPYHLVGPGDANEVAPKDLELLDESDVVLAIGDGMDAGTVFEVGYAKALGKPVIFYAENEVGEDIKMFEGTHCQMVKDFPTAIYKTVWEALAL
jgi:nucleoside 2-deoxyribosyltransferase